MTRKEFAVMTHLERIDKKPSQRSIASGIGSSVGTVNKILAALLERKWITQDLEITENGYNALEPYRVNV